MTLNVVTICLDGILFLPRHLYVLNKLSVPWTWSICEGYAEPIGCTSWCKPMPPRVSRDGSHEFLRELAQNHPRVKHYHSPSWPGKLSMFQKMTENLTEPGLILQMDADECWEAHQLEAIMAAFKANPKRDAALFRCVYFLGPNIRIISRNTYGGHEQFEWLRCWRFTPGQQWLKHEPPVFHSPKIRPFTQDQTENMGLVFHHYAYAFEQQLAWKEQYYSYASALESWRRLQQNKVWPARVGDYLSWVKDNAMCDQIVKS